MALKSCRECNKKVSTEAPVCPSCGVPNPTEGTLAVKRKRSNETAKSISNIKLLATIYILVLGIYAYSLANLSLYEYFPGFILGALPIVVLLWPLLLLLFKKLLGKG
jgi:RNA polymerase subunit RPABC4/transcription elongation factor Spt4